MTARQVERLAVTVASSQIAGHGWALREVLFPCGLPAEEVAELVSRQFALLARDDGWARTLGAKNEARAPGPGRWRQRPSPGSRPRAVSRRPPRSAAAAAEAPAVALAAVALAAVVLAAVVLVGT